MKYIIDTHILIWLAVSPEKISYKVLKIIENPQNEICVSTVSLWEIAIKLSVGKLDLKGMDIGDLVQICEEQDIKIVQLPASAAIQYRKLPVRDNHKDPFDRVLISLCICENYILLSSDAKFSQYISDGLVFVS